MSRATTAIALSALVFPGVGQYYLGHRVRALLFIAPALAAAAYFFGQVYQRANAIVDGINSGTISPDPVAILARIHQQGQDASMHTELAGAVMIACWLISIVDAWYLSRQAAPIVTPKDTP
ncbi:MAG: hypothetical protein V4723_18890 [Pseudomonadota bacterium]